MPSSKWSDGDMQGHDAYRKGQEGRHQDEGATSYEVGLKQYRCYVPDRVPERKSTRELRPDQRGQAYLAAYKKALQ